MLEKLSKPSQVHTGTLCLQPSHDWMPKATPRKAVWALLCCGSHLSDARSYVQHSKVIAVLKQKSCKLLHKVARHCPTAVPTLQLKAIFFYRGSSSGRPMSIACLEPKPYLQQLPNCTVARQQHWRNLHSDSPALLDIYSDSPAAAGRHAQ